MEGRDPVEDIRKINRELAAYDEALSHRPQVIAANKMDAVAEGEDPLKRLRETFEPEGIRVFPISAVSGEGVRELLYYVKELLSQLPEETLVFEQEYNPEEHFTGETLPFTVSKSEEEENTYLVEGPRIEKMLGYTNLESEKGFQFFQKFLKDNGILDELEALGIQEGDTVKLYGLQFEYFK